jgi:hypothetical protein
MKLLLEDVRNTSLRELQQLLANRSKEARFVTLEDLASVAGTPCTGVYFFFERDESAYIGKASSRAFIERVPSHFDTRPDCWFGTLIKRLNATTGGTPDAGAILDRALGMRISLLLVGDPETAEEVERCLRHAFGPSLNTPKNRKTVDLNRTLSDVLCAVGSRA